MQYFGRSRAERWWHDLTGRLGGNARRGTVAVGFSVLALAALGISNAATGDGPAGSPASIAVLAPVDGAVVQGGGVAISASVRETAGLAGVQFRLDGAAIGPEDGDAPYGMAWDTAGVTEGRHSITAVVRHADGRTVESAPISVTVDNVLDATAVVESRIGLGSDDAEQSADGTVQLTGRDLELVRDRSDQTIGLRFGGVIVPRGAIIRSATIQFTSARADDGPTALTIRGEAVDDAAIYSTGRSAITGRARTSASVIWTPAAWQAQSQTAAQRSPDLSAVISEITGRSGWEAGNALAISMTGSGRRVARSYDAAPDQAPRLRVEYEVDRVAPAAPSSLQAGRTAPDLVTLRWPAAADNVATASYRIYRDGQRIGMAAGTEFGDTAARPGVKHLYTVEAVDTSGNVSPRSPGASD